MAMTAIDLGLATGDDLRERLPPELREHVLRWEGWWSEHPGGAVLHLRLLCDCTDALWPVRLALLAVVQRLGSETNAGALSCDLFLREPGLDGDAREAAWRLSDGRPAAWMPPQQGPGWDQAVALAELMLWPKDG